MKFQESEPCLLIKKGGELSLSGPALTGLLQAVLDKGVPFRFRAKGFSMSPFIKDGDVITVTALSSGSLCPGDILAFIQPMRRRLLVHRLIGKRDTYYLMKGDSAPEADEPVPRENILGCVKRVERNGKKIHLGLGPERILVAFLTRRGLLSPLLLPMRRFIRPIIRRLAT